MIQLNRLEAIALAVLALLAGITLGTPVGLWYGSSHATAVGAAKMADLRRETAEASAAAVSAAAEKLALETARGDRLSAALSGAESRIDAISRQLINRVDHVTTVYREAPGAALKPIPQCIFTRGWLRGYNAAIGAAVPPAVEATGTLAQAPGAGIAPAGEDELAPADIDAKSILTHQVEYGARNQKLEEQLNRLIDFNEGKDAQ